MALSEVKVNLGTGGLGAPLQGDEHKCGFAIWRDISVGGKSYPSGFSSSDKIKKILSLQQAESLGIESDTTDYKDVHYHISEFFRMNPKGILWLGIFDAASPDYADIREIQYEANGEVYQIGVYTTENFSTSSTLTTAIGNIQTELETLRDEKMPAVALLAGDFSSVTSGQMASALPNLTSESGKRVSVVISQDGAAQGKSLFQSLGHSITDIGAKLGALSSAQVHENIGWVGEFDFTDGSELDVPALANGDLNKSQTTNSLDTLDNNHYIFLRKFVGRSGTFTTYAYTATSAGDDRNTLDRNRVLDKVTRVSRTRLQPRLNSPVYLNDDGTLGEETIADFEEIVNTGLDNMVAAGEISAYDVIIDPTQDILSTNELEIAIEIVPVGTAKKIIIPLKYTTSV